MGEKIAVFGFNTKSGSVELHDVTIEDIIAFLAEKFPSWSAETISKIAHNSNFYKEVIPLEKEEKKAKGIKKERVHFREPIVIDGYEINPLLRLGKSIHAYHKNGYRQWGVCVNEVFDDWKITPLYNDFERKWETLLKCVKTETMEELKPKVTAMCDKLKSLSIAVSKSGLLKQDKDKEYICGCYKRLGLSQLMERADVLVDECVSALT